MEFDIIKKTKNVNVELDKKFLNKCTRLDKIRKITTKAEFANILNLELSVLNYVLYALKPKTQYTRFKIKKKSLKDRIILAPSKGLKNIQSRLSNLLQDCHDVISADRLEKKKYKQVLSHGFVRQRSIFTNAILHRNKKNVLNIDLKDYFDHFNFGRVRDFFIKNKDFKINSDIATMIAQIACYDNKLPQGSPCSPIIANLMTQSLDIRLAKLAKKHSCIYSRYADDITFSTRKKHFPKEIMMHEIDQNNYQKFIASEELKSVIENFGFTLNEKKTRIQLEFSRQDVTGLVVNKKLNTEYKYRRTVRAQCHSLFKKGTFKKTKSDEFGNIKELEGQLNFIDQVDYFNRKRLGKVSKGLTGRESTFSRFLYYKLFYANKQPTILCEGQTDIVYLKCAIKNLSANYPLLDSNTCFFKYSNRTRFLLELYGGVNYLSKFISSFDENYQFYTAPIPKKPVIIILDNDSGLSVKSGNSILSLLVNNLYPTKSKDKNNHNGRRKELREKDFIRVCHNLYIVLTPLKNNNESKADSQKADSQIEDCFDEETRNRKLHKKTLDLDTKPLNKEKNFSKMKFAIKVVKVQKKTINFAGFKPLLDRVVKATEHYEKQIELYDNLRRLLDLQTHFLDDLMQHYIAGYLSLYSKTD